MSQEHKEYPDHPGSQGLSAEMSQISFLLQRIQQTRWLTANDERYREVLRERVASIQASLKKAS